MSIYLKMYWISINLYHNIAVFHGSPLPVSSTHIGKYLLRENPPFVNIHCNSQIMAIPPEHFTWTNSINLLGGTTWEVSVWKSIFSILTTMLSRLFWLVGVVSDFQTLPLECLSTAVWSVCRQPESFLGRPSCVSFWSPEASSERSDRNTCPTEPHGRPWRRCSLEATIFFL